MYKASRHDLSDKVPPSRLGQLESERKSVWQIKIYNICIHICIYVYRYIYIYICMYTYIYIYI